MPLNKYKRILLKLSGEALANNDNIIDPKILTKIVNIIQIVLTKNIQLAIVIGGGNIFRGEAFKKNGANKITSDHIGMLATIINGLAINDACLRQGIKSSVMSAINMSGEICETLNFKKAKNKLTNGEIVIFVAGTGNPCFTTDSAAVLRAIEIDANIVFKATNVDGIYTSDPNKDKTATKYNKLSFDEAIIKNLKIMDMTAFTMCKENNIDICVFSMIEEAATLVKILEGENLGTIVSMD